MEIRAVESRKKKEIVVEAVVILPFVSFKGWNSYVKVIKVSGGSSLLFTYQAS